jgi:hypothetical protein
VGLRLVAGREHDAAPDGYWAAPQARVVTLLDSGEEGVDVGVKDGRLVHERMFAYVRIASREGWNRAVSIADYRL